MPSSLFTTFLHCSSPLPPSLSPCPSALTFSLPPPPHHHHTLYHTQDPASLPLALPTFHTHCGWWFFVYLSGQDSGHVPTCKTNSYGGLGVVAGRCALPSRHSVGCIWKERDIPQTPHTYPLLSLYHSLRQGCCLAVSSSLQQKQTNKTSSAHCGAFSSLPAFTFPFCIFLSFSFSLLRALLPP